MAHSGLFDIAANMSDARFKGEYYGKQCHEEDFDKCIKRANLMGVKKFLFASGYIEDGVDSYNLSLKSDDFYATVGIHPCRSLEPFKGIGKRDEIEEASLEVKQKLLAEYIAKIDKMLGKSEHKSKFIAVGECGLDYDRFEYAGKAE